MSAGDPRSKGHPPGNRPGTFQGKPPSTWECLNDRLEAMSENPLSSNAFGAPANAPAPANLVDSSAPVYPVGPSAPATPVTSASFSAQEVRGLANPLVGTAPVSSLRNVVKQYGRGETAVSALDDVSVDFYQGQFTTIMGPSGSGKSTMLNVLAGLDTINSGVVSLEGVPFQSLSDDKLTRLRRDRIGFVFQSFNLIPTLDARANILLPSRLAGQQVDPGLQDMIIYSLGIQDRLHHLPSQLSGGQQQRVALARALVTAPAIVVADEPTGNLDSSSTEEVLTLLRAAVDDLGQTIIMVTHDQHVAQRSDRVVVVRDGRISADLWQPTPEQIEQVA